MIPNWVDLVVLTVLGLFVWNGYHKGFIRQAGELGLLVLSIFLTFTLYSRLADFLAAHFHLSLLSGFTGKLIALVILWVGTQIVFFFLWRIFYQQLPEGLRESQINKWFGAVPGVLWGVIFVAVVLTLAVVFLGFFPNYQPYRQAVTDSVTDQAISSQASWFSGNIIGNLQGIFNGGVSFRTIEPNSTETYQLGYKTTNVTVDTAAENQMLALVNAERLKRGLSPLVMDDKLRQVAEAHARDMFARGYFAHVTPEGQDPFARMKAADITYIVAGENLALAPDVISAQNGLMNSPGHRANILAPEYGKIGIGVINGGGYGLMFAQEFTN